MKLVEKFTVRLGFALVVGALSLNLSLVPCFAGSPPVVGETGEGCSPEDFDYMMMALNSMQGGGYNSQEAIFMANGGKLGRAIEACRGLLDDILDLSREARQAITRTGRTAACVRCIISACFNGGHPGGSIGAPNDTINACLAFFKNLQGWQIGQGGVGAAAYLISIVLTKCHSQCK
jgi:hypothetical protein